jgi:hypothetical protein
VIAVPLFLGIGLAGGGVRMLTEHPSIGSVVGGLLLLLAGLVLLAGLALYLSRPVK